MMLEYREECLETSSLITCPPLPSQRPDNYWAEAVKLANEPDGVLLRKRLDDIKSRGDKLPDNEKALLLQEAADFVEAHKRLKIEGLAREQVLSIEPNLGEGSERFVVVKDNGHIQRNDIIQRSKRTLTALGLVGLISLTVLSGCSLFGRPQDKPAEKPTPIPAPAALTLENLGIKDRNSDSRYLYLGSTNPADYIGYKFEGLDPIGIEEGGARKYDYSALGDDQREGGRIAADTVNYLIRVYGGSMLTDNKFSAADKQVIEDLRRRPFDPKKGDDLKLLASIKQNWRGVYNTSYDMLMQDETRAIATINRVNMNSAPRPIVRNEGDKKVVWIPHPLSLGVPRAAVPRGDLPGYYELEQRIS